MIYLEEAWEECPDRQNTINDAVSLGEMLSRATMKFQCFEVAMSETEA